MGSLPVGHDWETSLSLFTFTQWRRKWQPTPVFLPGESQGWGSLVGCHLWGRTESDTTEATEQRHHKLQKISVGWEHYCWSHKLSGILSIGNNAKLNIKVLVVNSGKESTCQCRRYKRHVFDPWVGKIPCRRKWQLTPVFLPWESHGERSFMGCSLWGCKE